MVCPYKTVITRSVECSVELPERNYVKFSRFTLLKSFPRFIWASYKTGSLLFMSICSMCITGV